MRIQLTEMSREIHEIKSDLKDLRKRMDTVWFTFFSVVSS